jgi:transglutaminase-like putative cysteine protease
MRRVLTLGIVASWLVLVVMLVRRQAPPEPLPATPLPLTGVTARDEWFGVYKDHRKIGYAHRVVATRDDGYVFSEDSEVALAMLGVPQKLKSTLRAETNDAFALRAFSYTLATPATTFTASGTSDDHTLRARYGPKGQEVDLVLPLSQPIALPSTLRPRILADDPAPGTRYTVPVFSPLTASNEPMTVVVEGRERLATSTGAVDTIRLAEEHQSVRTHAWIDPDGNVVREDALLGFTLEREPEAQARTGVDPGAPLDLVAASGIPLAGTIASPRTLAHLTLRVTGPAGASIPSSPPRQRLAADLLRITREAMPADAAPLGPIPADVDGGAPAAALAASPFIESDDPALRNQARAIVGDATDPRLIARRLVRWVHDEVEKAPSITVPSAREVLQSKRGDCNEHAVLLAGLARAAGIPARVIAGAVYANDGFYYHAWNELWVGAWVSADAVFDQLPADATHVKLIEGGLERQTALAGIIGQLAFAVVEERPE